MQKKLWEATASQKKNSNLRKFEKILNQNHKFTGFGNYNKLLKWSIKNPNLFWSAIWDFSEIKGTKSTKFKKNKKFINNKFLFNSKLNFTENLLKKNTNEKAITFLSENGFREIRTWKKLKENVENLSFFLKKNNLRKMIE